MYSISFYEDASGNSPVEQFLAELSQKAFSDKRAGVLLRKYLYTIELLKQRGTRCGDKFTKHIGGKLWELRTNDHRTFFFLWQGNDIVLLHTFRKEAQKTPKQEIEKAERALDDWVVRSGSK